MAFATHYQKDSTFAEMGFVSSPRFNLDMGLNTNPSLGILESTNDEDDEIFAQMRRQVLALTSDYDDDGDDDDFSMIKFAKPSYGNVTSVTNPRGPSSSVPFSQGSMSLWQNEYSTRSDSIVGSSFQPARPFGISKGTGVFIPAAKSRTNYKPKAKVNGKRLYKPVESKQTDSDHETQLLDYIASPFQ